MGGSIFFFVESKTFEFLVEEGGTFYSLRIFERYMDSLRLVFMGKDSALRLLSYVEDLMSNTRPENFARTFRDGSKVFILQLGFNAHGSFLMISELFMVVGRASSLYRKESWVVGGEVLAFIFVRLLRSRHSWS